MGDNGITANVTDAGAQSVDVNAQGLNQQGLQNNTDGQGGGTPSNSAQNEPQGVKTYSAEELQAETDRRVTEALKTAQGKWQKEFEEKLAKEKAETERLAKMNADERAKAEFDKKVKDFDEKLAKHEAERLTFECTRQLAAEGLPVEFADMLTGSDSESTQKNIAAFKTAFSNAIEAAVTERLKGTTPKGTNAGTEPKDTDPFLAGFGG